MQGFIEEILNLIAPRDPPGSSIFIIIVAITVTLFSTLVSRRIIDLDKLKRYTKETKDYNSMKLKATRSQDRRLMKKVEDNEKRAQKMQRELATMRIKPLIYTLIPTLLIFVLMNGHFGSIDTIVANIPFSLPENIIFPFGVDCSNIRYDLINGDSAQVLAAYGEGTVKLCTDNPSLHYKPTYIGWYFAVNIVIGAVIQKLAGLTPD